MFVVLSCIVGLILCIITHWIYTWRNPRCNGQLPPGSMGLPIIGETLQFFAPYTANDVSPFMRKRINRYGPVFRTSLVNHLIVISVDPEVNRFIFQQEGKLFRSWYMDTFDEIVGYDNVFSKHGFLHKYLRNLVLNHFGSESLKERLLPEVEEMTRKHLQLWSRQASVETKEAIATILFDFAAKKIFSYDESKSGEKLKENYASFLDGLISFPLCIPGTAYWKCLQGRKKAMKTIKDMLNKRRASYSPQREQKDFLDLVVEEMKKDQNLLAEGTALDLLFALPFATFESVSTALTFAIQYLGDNPLALQKLTEEHEAILRNRETTDAGITWKEYKSMIFTEMVINETIRLGNFVPAIFRKVMKDVELKGYTIPEGWIIVVCPPAVHLNPEKYEDPLTFNPWRWKAQALNSGSPNFMAFGGGVRLCVGAEFAKLQMAVFLHYLVTEYNWKVIKGGEVVRKPGVVFPNGFHIQLLEKNPIKTA